MSPVTAELKAQPEIVLRLPLDYASTLRAVVGQIGGSPLGRRGHCDAIHAALMDANVPSVSSELHLSPSGSGLYFEDPR